MVGGTSEKFVPEPTGEDILTDAINGLRRFKDTVRWKAFHKQLQEEKDKQNQTGNNSSNNNNNTQEDEQQQQPHNPGLNTNLKPTKINLSAPKADDETEQFLQLLEEEILREALDKVDTKGTNPKSHKIKTLQQKLRNKADQVVVPTDKTNSFRTVSKSNYSKWVISHLAKNAKEVPRSQLTDVQKLAFDILRDKTELGIFSDKEEQFVQQTIQSKAIPSPKLLIKDHKNPDSEGNFPTRLVVPANNFTSGFPRIGYLGIKRILDNNKVNYMSKTIIQASNLKEQLETLGITCNNSTIVSIDAENFYPSVRLKLVRKAVYYFSRNLPEEDQINIEHCLDLIKFGMQHTLITFIDKYYEYDGDKNPEEKGLTIGGYESAWLADLVGSYILAHTKSHFRNSKYYGLYRDDGIAVFNNKLSYDDISKWRSKFQKSVNRLAGGTYLQFTCSVWLDQSRRELPPIQDDQMISIESDNYFPYLDTELIWSDEGDLQFQVHLKPNQQLKYLNSDSIHTKSCFKAIPAGVYKRLSKLTTITETNKDLQLDEIYPQHFQALKHAGLITKKIPTLTQQLQSNEQSKNNKQGKDKSNNKRNRSRTTYFCIGYSKLWSKPIHCIIKKIQAKFNLKWLRVSMSYHRFNNLREIFQGDLSRKLTEGIGSIDFEILPCNCRTGERNGACNYNNICRKSIVVYKVECNNTGKIYIGNTQQHFKNRMKAHFCDVQQLINKGVKSDSYARHFATQFDPMLYPDSNPTPANQRKGITCSIIWQGNPISVAKTFATKNCALCAKERVAILKQHKSNPQLLINSNNEIYGACRHHPKFHRYVKQTPSSTDESTNDERVNTTHEVTTETTIRCNVCLADV
mgnify:FL=1